MTESSESQSRLTQVGEACAIALAAALCVGMLSAVRARSAGAALFDAWLGASALLLAVLLPLTLLHDRAARGLRGLLGSGVRRSLGVGLALWMSLSVVLLTVLAAVLKATTNHRGLGGAAYGVVGVVVVGAAAVLAWRLVCIGEGLHRRGVPRGALVAAVVGVGVLPVVAVASPLVHDAGASSSFVRAAVLDGLIAIVLTSLLLGRALPATARRLARIVAIPLAAGVLVVGFVRIETSQTLGAGLRAGGGLASVVLGALESWTDRDGDGHGAHFGGHDCDEGDARRHPGAPERADDGVDSDCDGRDGAVLPADVRIAQHDTEPSLGNGLIATAAAATAEPPPAERTTLAATVAPAAAEATGVRPDIIVVTLDTVRADFTSAYGFAQDTTPALKALAARGTLFERAFAPATTTQGALVPLVSGRTFERTPNTNVEWPALRDEVDTLAERLARSGYATAAVSSFTWLRADRGFTQGFGAFDETPFRDNHPERRVTGTAALKSATALHDKLADGSAPLFLWVHLFDAHAHYLAHEGIDFGDSNKGLYLGEIAFVDRQLGKLVEHVGKSSRGDRTLWVVHGSHGEAFAEHGKHIGHGTELYNEALQVPLVVVRPGAAPGRYGKAAVSTLDIVPTVLDYAAAPAEELDGVSLRAMIDGDREKKRAPIVAQAPRRTALVDWPFKLLVKHRKAGPDRLLLFDMQADPGETRDVSAEHGGVLKRLDDLRRQLTGGAG